MRAAVALATVEDYRRHDRERQDALTAVARGAARAARPELDWARVWRGVAAEERRLALAEENEVATAASAHGEPGAPLA